MIRKIFPLLVIFAIAAMVSCNDSEPIKPKDKPAVAPPPRSVGVSARLESCLGTSEVADLYYRVNGGSWTLIGSVTSTSCGSIGSLSASTGDLIEFRVLENASAQPAAYRVRTGTICPTSALTAFCGDGTFGNLYSNTLGSSTSSYSIQVSVNTTLDPPPCGRLVIC